MGIVQNAATAPTQAAPQRHVPQAGADGSVLGDDFQKVEPNTRFPKLWAPPVPQGEKEGPSLDYDVKISLVKMLAASPAKMAADVAEFGDNTVFTGVSYYETETFILEVEVVSSSTPQCPVGSIRTISTRNKDKYGYFGKEVKAIICSCEFLDLGEGNISDVRDPLNVDKNDVRAVAGNKQAALGKVIRVTVRNKIARDTTRPFLQQQFTVSPLALSAPSQKRPAA